MAPVTLLRRGDRITSYTGDAVDAADVRTPLGFPPLHMHHIHVQREEVAPRSGSNHAFVASRTAASLRHAPVRTTASLRHD
eukprot:6106781-Prymnesium_polylepis.1